MIIYAPPLTEEPSKGWAKQRIPTWYETEQELHSYLNTSIDELLAASMLEEARAGWVPTTTTNANGSPFLALQLSN